MFSPGPDLWLGPSSGGVLEVHEGAVGQSSPDVIITVGDEAGDALMLDFLDQEGEVGNRGTLLGLEVGVASPSGCSDRWWLRGRYRKDDWLAYRRFHIRTPIAPVQEWRENVGTDERFVLRGGLERGSDGWTVRATGGAQVFPALWMRDAGTRRTTKWRGVSGVGVLTFTRGWGPSGGHELSIALGAEGSRAKDVHRDSEQDVGFSGDLETIEIRTRHALSDRARLRQKVYGRVEGLKITPAGGSPSHGFDGPASPLSGGVSVGFEHGTARERRVELEIRLDKREYSRTIPSAGLRISRTLSPGPAFWMRALVSGHLPDLFHEYGWSGVTHPSLGSQEVRFEGRPLEPETFEFFEFGFEVQGRAAHARLVLYHERVRDRIVPASEVWVPIRDDRERVRSGYWTNGGRVRSTGLELESGTGGGWGSVSWFLFVRDVGWEAGRAQVSHPPMGGRAGAGLAVMVRLPKRTEFWARVRSVACPRFASYGSWTEETESDRLRWDAALATRLSDRWEAAITAVDVLDEGHLEVPGGNAVGFRVVGELRYGR